MFFLKKLISRFLFPVPLGLGLIVAGLILLVWTKRRRVGAALVAAGAAGLWLCGYGTVTEGWVRSIEYLHRPVKAEQAAAAVSSTGSVEWILVPGQGVSTDGTMPAHSRMNGYFLQRIVEAVRLFRMRPEARIAIAIPGTVMSDAERRALVDDLLATLAVPEDRVVVVGGARDTQEEMARFRELAGTNRTWLATNASHMPRALILARRAGLDPVPSPGGYLTGETRPGEPFNPAGLFPSAEGLTLAETAVYERLGLLFERTRERSKTTARDGGRQETQDRRP